MKHLKILKTLQTMICIESNEQRVKFNRETLLKTFINILSISSESTFNHRKPQNRRKLKIFSLHFLKKRKKVAIIFFYNTFFMLNYCKQFPIISFIYNQMRNLFIYPLRETELNHFIVF